MERNQQRKNINEKTTVKNIVSFLMISKMEIIHNSHFLFNTKLPAYMNARRPKYLHACLIAYLPTSLKVITLLYYIQTGTVYE